MAPLASARELLVATLRREVARLENCRPPEDDRAISTGSPALDRLLPAGGLRRGTLVEYLTSEIGSGAGTLALAAAREACREGRALVVVDAQGGRGSGQAKSPEKPGSAGASPSHFYPPAAAAWGIDLARLLVLRPASQANALWALDQALRCPGVGAVWSQWDRMDVRDFRRLQLAAECGGTLGLLVRPARYRGQPTWADVQWEVQSLRSKVQSPKSKVRRPWTLDHGPWTLRVELVRCRGAAGGQVVLLERDEIAGVWREAIGDATDSMSVVAELADSVRHERTRRA